MSVLPQNVAESLKNCWHGNDSPLIITDSEALDKNPFGKVDIAAAMLGIHFYNMKAIKVENLDLVILHEMAHDYCFFTGQHDYNFYRFGSKSYRTFVEGQISDLSKEWLKSSKEK